MSQGLRTCKQLLHTCKQDPCSTHARNPISSSVPLQWRKLSGKLHVVECYNNYYYTASFSHAEFNYSCMLYTLTILPKKGNSFNEYPACRVVINAHGVELLQSTNCSYPQWHSKKACYTIITINDLSLPLSRSSLAVLNCCFQNISLGITDSP